MSAPDARAEDMDSPAVLLDQAFESSEMGDSMDADLLPELSGETWVAAHPSSRTCGCCRPMRNRISSQRPGVTKRLGLSPDCCSGICPSTRKGGCGGAGLPR